MICPSPDTNLKQLDTLAKAFDEHMGLANVDDRSSSRIDILIITDRMPRNYRLTIQSVPRIRGTELDLLLRSGLRVIVQLIKQWREGDQNELR